MEEKACSGQLGLISVFINTSHRLLLVGENISFVSYLSYESLYFRGKLKKGKEIISYISYISYELYIIYRKKLKKRWERFPMFPTFPTSYILSWEIERNGEKTFLNFLPFLRVFYIVRNWKKGKEIISYISHISYDFYIIVRNWRKGKKLFPIFPIFPTN